MKLDFHMEAALEMIRALADHIEEAEGLMLKANLIGKRSDISATARRLVSKIDANAPRCRPSFWKRICGITD